MLNPVPPFLFAPTQKEKINIEMCTKTPPNHFARTTVQFNYIATWLGIRTTTLLWTAVSSYRNTDYAQDLKCVHHHLHNNNNNTIKSTDSRVRPLVEATLLFTSKNGTEQSFGGEPKNTSTSCSVVGMERGWHREGQNQERTRTLRNFCVMRMFQYSGQEKN